MGKPLIGITTAVRANDLGWKYLAAYSMNVVAVERAGGLPVLLPCTLETESLHELYEHVDAVLLPGGGDIDPENYGEPRHPLTNHIDLIRDRAEIAIARWAAQDQRPLFGICRGHQLVNVALGGTLYQDIPSQLESDIDHDPTTQQMPRNAMVHSVQIEEGSHVHKLLGQVTIEVNSIHHQSIKKIADGLQVTAYAPDGVIEAAEFAGNPFYHTVQWHPEDLIDDVKMQKLFDALVEAARQRKFSTTQLAIR